MITNSNKMVAAIDVGTNYLRLLLAQITPDGRVFPIEDLFQPTRIGRGIPLQTAGFRLKRFMKLAEY